MGHPRMIVCFVIPNALKPATIFTIVAIALAGTASCAAASFEIVDQSSNELTTHNFDFQIEVSCTVFNSGHKSGVAKVVATLEQIGVDEWTRTDTGRVDGDSSRTFTLLFSEPLYWLAKEGHRYDCDVEQQIIAKR